MTIMCDDVHICTYSMQLEVPGGYLCPRWYIIAFQMTMAGGALLNWLTLASQTRFSAQRSRLFCWRIVPKINRRKNKGSG